MTLAKSINKIPAVNVDSLLKQLERGKAAAAAEKKSMPRLTAWVGSGPGHSGEFVSYQAPQRNENPVLLLQSNVGTTTADLTYIPGHMISSVTIHIVKENMHMIAFGAINEQHSGDAPTKLQIEGLMAEWSKAFASSYKLPLDHQVHFADLPASDQAKFTLKKLLSNLHKNLEQIAGEPMGRDALAEKVKSLAIVITKDPPKITLENGLLTAHCQNIDDDILTPDVAEMRASIESLL